MTLDADDSSGAGGDDFETTWTEDSSGAVSIVDVDALITDVDSTTLTRLEVEFTNFSTGDALNFDLTGTSITSSTSGSGANITYEFNGPDSLANFNQLLQTLEFDNSSETPDETPRTILIRVVDQVSEVSADVTSTINVVASNDAPTVSVPGAQSVNQDDTLTLSAANGNSIVLGDVDATVLRVTVSASNGAVTLGSLTGLSFSSGDGVEDASVVFSGTIADVNTALDGMTFLHGVNHGGAATIMVTANDLAASGIGGVMTTTDTVAVAIAIPSGPPLAGDGFLQGDFLEIGIGPDGVLGSDNVAPAGFFSAGSILGAEVDHDQDGFGVGQVDGDFILPGTPEESWGISVGGLTTFNGNTVVAGISGSLGNFQDNGTTQSVDFAGSASGLSINSIHSVSRSDLFMDVEVTLTNSTGSTLSDIYYFRNVDPDNNFDTSSNFLTTNTVLSQGNDGSSAALVTATQVDGSFLGLLGFGNNARVTHGGFANHDPVAIFDGTGGLSQSGSTTADAAVSLAFRVDAIDAGESVTLRYRYIFGTQPIPVTDLDPGGTGGIAPDFNVTYTENDGAVSIVASDATLVDADSGSLASLTVRITNLQDGTAESLAADTTGTSITALAYDSGTGTLTLTGTDTIANYRQVLRTVTYENTSETPDTTTRAITFVASDGVNSSEAVTAFVSVISVNDVPTATDGNVTTDEDTLYTFTTGDFNYSDLDSDPFAQIQVTSLPTTGSLERLGVGVSVNDLISAADIAAGRLTYTPDVDVFGTAVDSFDFLVHDGSVFSATSNSMVIDVDSVNDDPVITSSSTALVNENDTTVLTATATDVDVPVQSLLFSISGTDASRFNVNTTSGELTFAVAPDFEAPVDSDADNVYEVTVNVSDGAGGLDTQNITVTVTDVDEFDITAISDVDVAAESVAENLPVGTAVGIEALATDSDGTDTVMYSLDTTSGGRFEIDPVSGVVTTDAVLDAETATDHTITVRATSTDGSTTSRDFTISIVDVDEFDTTAVADIDATADELDENAGIGSTVGITAFAEDLDVTDSVIFTLDDDAGGLLAIDPLSGAVTVADAIDYESTPSLDITIRATSTDGSFTTLDVTVPVNDLNDNLPVISPGQSLSFSEFVTNLTVVGTALATDIDTVGTPGNWAMVGGNDDGVFAIDAGTGTLSIADNSTVNFEVTSSYTLTLIVEDGSNVSVPETVTVNVIDENDVPVLVTNEDLTVVEGSSVMVTPVFLEVVDEDELPAEIIYTVSTPPAVGQFELTTGPGTAVASFSQDDIDGGRLIYIHDGSEADDMFTFTVSDGSGGTIGSTDHAITVSRVNDAPVNSVPGSQSTDEDTPFVFSAANGNLISVSDADVFTDPLGIRLAATNGTLTLSGTTGLTFTRGNGSDDVRVVFSGSAADINAALDGLQFSPDENYHGPATVRIEVRDFANSGSGGEKTDDDTINVTVRSINDAPVSFDDQYTVRQLATLTVPAEEGVSANDQDIEADLLTATVIDKPKHGTLVLNPDGSLTYVPDPLFFGQDTFTYVVNDGSVNSGVAEVVIMVQQTVSSGGDGVSTGTDSGGLDDGGNDSDGTGDAIDGNSTDNTGPDGTGVDPVTGNSGSENDNDDDSEDDENLGIDPSVSTTTTETTDDDADTEDDVIEDAMLASSVRRTRDRLVAAVTPYDMMSAAPLRSITTEIPELPESSVIQVLAQAGLWNELDQFEQEVVATNSSDVELNDLVVGTTSVAGTSLTVGYVIWLLRSGSILMSFMSSLPAWTMMDPLPVLEEALASSGDDDDDSLQSLISNHGVEC